MIKITCHQCGKSAMRLPSKVKAVKWGVFFCSNKCSGLYKRTKKSEEQLKEEKRIYDVEYRKKNIEKLSAGAKSRYTKAIQNYVDPSQEYLLSLFIYDEKTGAILSKLTGVERGYIAKSGYVLVYISGITHLAHRVIWKMKTGSWPKNSIDHINMNKADNRFENLRDVTHRINNENIKSARSTSKSGLLGAHRSNQGNKKWVSRIRAKGKAITLGYFETAEEAHNAYINAKRKLHEGCTI